MTVADDVTRDGEEGEEDENGLQNQCRFGEAEDAPDWVSLCYRARLRHKASWTELGKQVKRDWRTVRSNVEKYRRLVAEAYTNGDVGFLAEYIDGVEDDQSRASGVFSEAETPMEKISALKHITECRKLVAAAKGVVTERKGVQLGNAPGEELRVSGEADVRPNGDLVEVLSIIRDIGHLIAPVADGSDAEVDEIHTAQAPAEAAHIPDSPSA